MKIFKIATEKTNTPLMTIFNKFKERIKWKLVHLDGEYSVTVSKYIYLYYGYILLGGYIGTPKPSFKISIVILEKDNAYTGIDIKLLDSKNTPIYNNLYQIDVSDPQYVFKYKSIISSKFNLNEFEWPNEIKEFEIKKGKENNLVNKKIRLTKEKRPYKFTDASSLEFVLRPTAKAAESYPYSMGHEILMQNTDIETGQIFEKLILANESKNGGELKKEEALGRLKEYVERAKLNGYVEDGEIGYIPEWASKDNWDFINNTSMQKDESQKVSPVEIDLIKDTTRYEHKDLDHAPKINEKELEDLIGRFRGKYKISQDYHGFYTGDVPDYAVGFLGTSSVEASRVEAMFGRAHEAISLVNRFDSSLLTNISFIFNFAKSGAYGVYLSALDRAIKTKALKNKLEQNGYEIKITNSGLTAFPKENSNKTQDQVQKDIDSIYQDLESKGGTAIGINIGSIISAAKMDANESQSKDPDMWQWIAVLHLGGTIVHEAIHAKGNRDESPCEQREGQFIQWALPIINEEYKRSMESQGKVEEFSPLTITNKIRHAKTKSWYKTAQLSYYLPKHFLNAPIGSDISGRFPIDVQSEFGMSQWSMMAQMGKDLPIETRLGRMYMSPLPKGLSQEHDIIEEQLRKSTADIPKIDPRASMNELLSSGYDKNRGYSTLEGLLDEKRPKPLMVTLKKNASSLFKSATLFGWMNNLSISDGNTIPGLGDRVMLWEDRDEDFAWSDKDIRKQPRYNPEYDIKGFYYRWIEPRFKPQLFDDMTQDLSGTHPAKRFADDRGEINRILSILSEAKSKILKGNISCTRFIITEDMIPIIEKLFVGNEFNINVFVFGKTNDGNDILSVWISNKSIDVGKISRMENYFQRKVDFTEKIEEMIDSVTCVSKQNKISIDNIINSAKEICNAYKIENIYISGNYPLDIIFRNKYINSISFFGGFADQIIKVGSLMAEKLGIDSVYIESKKYELSFVYNGILVTFIYPNLKSEAKEIMVSKNIKEKDMDIYNRDFTVNMLIYDISTGKIKDPTSLAKPDINAKSIRTFFDPNYVCEKNPMVIFRAINLCLKYGFSIDESLKSAMVENLHCLFDGRYSSEQLQDAMGVLIKLDEGNLAKILEELNLGSMEELKCQCQ